MSMVLTRRCQPIHAHTGSNFDGRRTKGRVQRALTMVEIRRTAVEIPTTGSKRVSYRVCQLAVNLGSDS